MSTRYTELKFLHVIAILFYYLAEMKFQLGLTSWNFNSGWKSPYNRPFKRSNQDLDKIECTEVKAYSRSEKKSLVG